MSASAFISYSKSRPVLAQVAHALRRHGAPPWRDADSLPIGGRTREEIEAELERCHGALLWLSEDTLRSAYVLKVELPAIQRQVERRGLRVVPVFVGMEPRQGAEKVRELTGIEIADNNGHVLDQSAPIESEAILIATAYVDTALRDAAEGPLRAPVVRCVTRDDTAQRREEADNNFDWRDEYGNAALLPDPEVLRQLQVALAQTTSSVNARFQAGVVELELKCHLHIALALGHAFRKPTGMLPWTRVGDQWWPVQDVPTFVEGGLIEGRSVGPPDVDRAAVLISLTRDVEPGVNQTVATTGRRYEQRISLRPLSGPGQHTVPDPTTANAWAQQVADAMQRLRDQQPIAAIDLFMAAPVQFAVMLGWRLNAAGPINVYHWRGNQGPYDLAWTLPPT